MLASLQHRVRKSIHSANPSRTSAARPLSATGRDPVRVQSHAKSNQFRGHLEGPLAASHHRQPARLHADPTGRGGLTSFTRLSLQGDVDHLCVDCFQPGVSFSDQSPDFYAELA